MKYVIKKHIIIHFIVQNRRNSKNRKSNMMNVKGTVRKLNTVRGFSKLKIAWPAIDSISTKRNYMLTDIKCLKVTHKIAYLSALGILVIVLGTQVHRCAIHFWSAPTYFATTFVSQQKALFPSITICPVTAGYKKDILQVRRFM